MKGKSKQIGLIVGILIAIIIQLINIPGLEGAGKTALALTLMTIVFWAAQVAQSGFTSGLLLVLFIVFDVAGPEIVFSPWLKPTMYLVIGAYLIADAVKSSGLGERIAYSFILKFVKDFKSVIISIFLLTFVLSVLIPHPWPRAFLIMAVMKVLIDSANVPKKDAVTIGFTVFAASVPVSMIFLTGDAVINPLAVELSGANVGWIEYFFLMGVPMIIASILTCALILFLFKPSQDLVVNREVLLEKQKALGELSSLEKKVALWLMVAIVLWLTDSIHGINIGWITLVIPMLMSLPIIGNVLTPKSWTTVPMNVLLFLTAAMSISAVGGATGMNAWIANVLFPETLPANPFIFAFLIAVIGIIIHMLLGSVIAVMGIAIPAVLTGIAGSGSSITPLLASLIIYISVGIHYIFPFHHLNTLVGQGEENGMYTQNETIKLGLPLTIVVFIVEAAAVLWWMVIGYI